MHPYQFFQRREGLLGIGHLFVFLFQQSLTFSTSASYAIDDIGRGTREVTSEGFT